MKIICHGDACGENTDLQAGSWLDYGMFLMRTCDSAKAEECTREALALQPTEPFALLVHGCVLTTRGNHEQAGRRPCGRCGRLDHETGECTMDVPMPPASMSTRGRGRGGATKGAGAARGVNRVLLGDAPTRLLSESKPGGNIEISMC